MCSCQGHGLALPGEAFRCCRRVTADGRTVRHMAWAGLCVLPVRSVAPSLLSPSQSLTERAVAGVEVALALQMTVGSERGQHSTLTPLWPSHTLGSSQSCGTAVSWQLLSGVMGTWSSCGVSYWRISILLIFDELQHSRQGWSCCKTNLALWFFQCDHINDMINNLSTKRAPDCFWACFGV